MNLCDKISNYSSFKRIEELALSQRWALSQGWALSRGVGAFLRLAQGGFIWVGRLIDALLYKNMQFWRNKNILRLYVNKFFYHFRRIFYQSNDNSSVHYPKVRVYRFQNLSRWKYCQSVNSWFLSIVFGMHL